MWKGACGLFTEHGVVDLNREMGYNPFTFTEWYISC